MYKKLIAAAVSLAMVLGTVAPAFASSALETEESTMLPAVSEDPYMPAGTVIPEVTETPEVTESPEVTAPEAAETPDADILPEEEEAPAGGNVDSEEPEEPAEEPEEPAEDEEDDETDDEAEAEKKAAIKYRNGLAAYMRKINPKLGKKWSQNLAQTFIDIGEKYDLDPKVLMALAQRESRFYSKARSPYGYKGMMQTSDWLAKHYGYDPQDVYDYEVSITVAARYLKNLKNSFGTYTLALCGYMYGGTAVKNGNFSKKGAWKVMNTRSEIQEFLEKKNYV